MQTLLRVWELAQNINFNNTKKVDIDINKFPNNELKNKYKSFEIKWKLIEILCIFDRYNLNEDILYSLFLCDTIKKNKPKELSLILPYLPYSRKDRLDDDKNFIDNVSLKTLFKLFENAGVDKIKTLDLHNPVTSEFTEIEIENYNLFQILDWVFNPWNVFISADYWWAKVNAKLAKKYNCNNLVTGKSRNSKTWKSKFTWLYWIENLSLEDKEIYIYDDMIDTGWTICKLLDYLIENHKGFKEIKVIFTHPILSNLAVDKLNKYTKYNVSYITTNSFWNDYLEIDKCKVLDIDKIIS